VAVRRTRSALSQIKGVFPEAVVDDFKARFGWVGQITGPTRDMDVYLLGFGDYRDSLPADYRDHLEPMHRFLEAHRKAEQAALARELDSPRFRKILQDWREFLEAPVPEQPEAPNAARPIRELASRRILKMYKRVLNEGRAIDPETPPEHLHELRKSCKKLRYLIEFTANIYPKKPAKAVIKNLKTLLDNLGTFQDLEVQAGKLRGLARQMSEEGEVPVDTLLAMGMLVDGLLERQRHARAEFQDRFAGFDSDANRRAYQQLFALE
jgi:CHAD domain-containing protein